MSVGRTKAEEYKKEKKREREERERRERERKKRGKGEENKFVFEREREKERERSPSSMVDCREAVMHIDASNPDQRRYTAKKRLITHKCKGKKPPKQQIAWISNEWILAMQHQYKHTSLKYASRVSFEKNARCETELLLSSCMSAAYRFQVGSYEISNKVSPRLDDRFGVAIELNFSGVIFKPPALMTQSLYDWWEREHVTDADTFVCAGWMHYRFTPPPIYCSLR